MKKLALLLMITLAISCSQEQIEIQDPLVGEWERYIPIRKDTLWTNQDIAFYLDGTGWMHPTAFTWSGTEDLLEITWEDGSGFSYPYKLRDPDNLVLHLNNGESTWRRVR